MNRIPPGLLRRGFLGSAAGAGAAVVLGSAPPASVSVAASVLPGVPVGAGESVAQAANAANIKQAARQSARIRDFFMFYSSIK